LLATALLPTRPGLAFFDVSEEEASFEASALGAFGDRQRQ
jgi:hypothetical protein